MSVFTTTGGVFPWRQREKREKKREEETLLGHNGRNSKVSSCCMSTSPKPTVKTDGHFRCYGCHKAILIFTWASILLQNDRKHYSRATLHLKRTSRRLVRSTLRTHGHKNVSSKPRSDINKCLKKHLKTFCTLPWQ